MRLVSLVLRTVRIVVRGASRVGAKSSFLVDPSGVFVLSKMYVGLVFVNRDMGGVSGLSRKGLFARCPTVP